MGGFVNVHKCIHYCLYTVQDDLLARVIFGEFACGKLICAIENAQIETKIANFILAISAKNLQSPI